MVTSFSPEAASLTTVWREMTAPLSLPLSNTPATVESAVTFPVTGSGAWKEMSRSASTTITRLRSICPGLAPQTQTEANVGTTFRASW